MALPQTAPGTICDLLGHPSNDIRYEDTARRYGRGFAELGYRDRSLVLVALRRPADVIAVTLGAWWAGHHVVHVAEADHRRRDRIALRIGAVLQVCDAEDIVDEEHVLHRDVPAVPPEDLALQPSSWRARCLPSDPALASWSGTAGAVTSTYSHADLIDAAADEAGTSSVLVPADASGERVARALVLALVAGVPLVLAADRTTGRTRR
ncbi:hypothetical protein ACWEIJ_15140 [Lentzea sp. NPDC004789]